MHQTRNTLSENSRTQSVEPLNRRLAAAIDLHSELKQAHWNGGGPSFIGVHALLDNVAGEADDCSDLIAERAAGLGGVAEGTIQVAAERSFLIPYTSRIADESQHTFAVAVTLAASGQSARDAIGRSETVGDADTADLFTGISGGVDHQLWLVESHVAPK